MNIELCAIGKFKKSEAEQALTLDYLARAQIIGRKLGINTVELHEIDCKTNAPDKPREADAFLAHISPAAFVIVLDENGENISSRQLASKIEKFRDTGTKQLIFTIGGADGHGQKMKDRADLALAFGKQTWPHKLCRTMAAEQIYRALGIIANTPYHRD